VNPNIPNTEADRREVQAAAQAVGQQLLVLDVSSERQIETAFATLVQRGAGALQVGTGAFLLSQREQVVALAARNGIPAIHPLRESPLALPASTERRLASWPLQIGIGTCELHDRMMVGVRVNRLELDELWSCASRSKCPCKVLDMAEFVI
jgi:hypothetical protein